MSQSRATRMVGRPRLAWTIVGVGLAAAVATSTAVAVTNADPARVVMISLLALLGLCIAGVLTYAVATPLPGQVRHAGEGAGGRGWTGGVDGGGMQAGMHGTGDLGGGGGGDC